MIRSFLLLLACATVACAPMTAQVPPVATSCGAEKLGGLIGRQRSTETGEEALRLSHAARIRWIAPDTMVTMEYSESRLNLYIDKKGKILSANCG